MKNLLTLKSNPFMLSEGVMSEIDIMAKEARNVKEFIKEFMAEYGDKVKDNAETKKWLESMYKDAVNEKSKGLWANIHAKRKRGEKPARKGSKAYKKAKKAADKINNEEEELDESISIPTFVVMVIGAAFAGRIALMPEEKMQKALDTTKATVKAIARELPIIGDKIKKKEFKEYQTKNVESYLADELTDQEIVDILRENPKMREAIAGIGERGQYRDYYDIIKELGGSKAGGFWGGIAHPKFKKLRKKIKDGEIELKESTEIDSGLNESERPRFKKRDRIEYRLTHQGGVGQYANAISKSDNVETGVIAKRTRTLAGFKYMLTTGLELSDHEILGLAESVTEGFHTFKGEMARDLKEKGVKLKKGDKVDLEIQPNNYVIYGPNRKQVVLDKRDFEGKIDQYVIYESVVNEKTSVKKGDYVLYKGNGTKWVKSEVMQVIPSAKKLHIDWNDEYIEVHVKEIKPVKESVTESKNTKELTKIFNKEFEDFPFDYKEEGSRIIIDPNGYNPDGTLFSMKDDWREDIIRTVRKNKKKWHIVPNNGGGLTIHVKESHVMTLENFIGEARAYKLKASEFGADTMSAPYNVKGEKTWRVHSTYAIDQVSGNDNKEERDVVFFESMPMGNDIYIKIGGIHNLGRTNASTYGKNFATTVDEWKNNPSGIAQEASKFLTDNDHLKWLNKNAKSEGQKIKWALKDDYSSVIEELVNRSLGLKESVSENKKWQPAASGGANYLEIQLDKKGYDVQQTWYKRKGAYSGDYVLEIPAEDEKEIIKILNKIDRKGSLIDESVNEAATERFLKSAAYNLAKQMRGKSASRTTLKNRLNSMPLANMIKNKEDLDKIVDYAMEEMGLKESVNEKIYRVYLDGDYEEHYTEDPFASKAKAIKQAKDMAKNHKGLIEVTPDDDVEDVVWTNESVNEEASPYLLDAEAFTAELEKVNFISPNIDVSVGPSRWARPGELRFRDHVTLRTVGNEMELYIIPVGRGTYELYTDKSYNTGRELKKGDAKTIVKAMKRYVNKMNESLNEAKLSKIYNAAKKGSYPVSLVATENDKVIKQELVGTPEIVPAAFNQLQKEYPNAKISIESRTGKTLFVESVNESRDDVVFVIDDGNLDNKFLMTRSLSRNLDYQHDSGDQYYVLPKRDFDRLEDYADSHGYGSESIYVIDESLSESNKYKKEAEAILQDLKDERGGIKDLHGMSMEDALDTVDTYGWKDSKQQKIAKELVALCNESTLNEKKQLPKEISKHKDIPSWARYVAQHSDGEWTWYEETPTMIRFKSGGGAWKQDGNQTYTGVKTDGKDWDKMPTYYYVKNGKITESRNLLTLENFLNEELPAQEIDPNKFQNPYKKDKDFFKRGYKDDTPMDDVVETKPVQIPANRLKPSQDAVYLGKALGMAIGGVEGGNLEAVISQDNRILDGHHRWAATIFNNPKAKVGGVQAQLRIGDLVPVLRQAGDALGNQRGLPPKTGDKNIFKATLKDVRDAVYLGKYMNPQFYDKDKAAQWYEEKGEDNVMKSLQLLQKVSPPAGAPPRADMPKIKPEQVKQVAKKLQGGAIDVRAPYVGDPKSGKNLKNLKSYLGK